MQLTLALDKHYNASLADFNYPAAAPLLDAMRLLHTSIIESLWVIGQAGAGKSHFLAAACQSFLDAGKNAAYLGMDTLLDAGPDALSQFDHAELIALDDVHLAQGNRALQEAIFHLINRRKGTGYCLIYASNLALDELDFEFLDLVTRLSLAHSVRLGSLDLDNRTLWFQRITKKRGLSFHPDIQHHFLTQGPHKLGDMTTLLLALAEVFEARTPSRAVLEKAKRHINDYALAAELRGL